VNGHIACSFCRVVDVRIPPGCSRSLCLLPLVHSSTTWRKWGSYGSRYRMWIFSILPLNLNGARSWLVSHAFDASFLKPKQLSPLGIWGVPDWRCISPLLRNHRYLRVNILQSITLRIISSPARRRYFEDAAIVEGRLC
jgi:hypothetical protein